MQWKSIGRIFNWAASTGEESMRGRKSAQGSLASCSLDVSCGCGWAMLHLRGLLRLATSPRAQRPPFHSFFPLKNRFKTLIFFISLSRWAILLVCPRWSFVLFCLVCLRLKHPGLGSQLCPGTFSFLRQRACPEKVDLSPFHPRKKCQHTGKHCSSEHQTSFCSARPLGRFWGISRVPGAPAHPERLFYPLYCISRAIGALPQ